MKYVEANPLRAGLVGEAHQWEWSSLWDRVTGERDLLHPLPFWLPEGWPTIVSTPLQKIDLDEIRRPLKKGRPTKPTDLRIA
jgi:putative transposase